MFNSTRVPVSRCLGCGVEMDAVTDPLTNAKPKVGDITICLRCGHIMAFGLGLLLRPLTDSEMLMVAGDKDLLRIQEARGRAMDKHAAKAGQEQATTRRWDYRDLTADLRAAWCAKWQKD